MPDVDPDDLDAIDREIRINELRHQAEELAGGPVIFGEMADCPPEVSEQFLRGVVDYEAAPWTTHLRQLEAIGVEMPAASGLDGQALSTRLWEVIHALAEIRVFLYNTNHLSDRELYELLREELLVEEVKDLPVDPFSAWHIDILGGCSEEDMYLHLKHYADDEERASWAEQYPEDEIPDHVDPPFDRDRNLPKR